jgi:hypothetical protein
MLPENYYEKQRERSRLHYHKMKEQYRESYEKRRDRCIAYMKEYNKEYYQDKREEILEKNKTYGHEVRAKAGRPPKGALPLGERRTKNIYIPPVPVIKKVDPSVFTILFDD